MSFYGSTSEKEKRGEITIDGQCRVEVMADSHSKSPLKTPGSKHHSKFQLFACQKTYEFQAADHRTRLQWVNAIKTAIEFAEQPVRYQRALLDKRKLARQEEKEREEEEDIRKASHALNKMNLPEPTPAAVQILSGEGSRHESQACSTSLGGNRFGKRILAVK